MTMENRKNRFSRNRILWITETAIMLAMLVAVQGFTAGLGNQFITGSCVNLILAITTLVVGLWGGVVVAGVSPFFAFLLGIGPKFIQLVPAIAVGNLIYVLILYSMTSKSTAIPSKLISLLAAAAAKFLVLLLLITKWLVPSLVANGVIPAKASATLIATFSWPQLVTALIGGILALAILPALKKALRKQ